MHKLAVKRTSLLFVCSSGNIHHGAVQPGNIKNLAFIWIWLSFKGKTNIWFLLLCPFSPFILAECQISSVLIEVLFWKPAALGGEAAS